MLLPPARHVRHRAVDRIAKTPGARPRSPGHQAALHRHRGDDLFFGSELKALFAHPEIERRISLAGLDCYLSLNYVPYPWTLVEGIEKLAPGTWLEWRDGQVLL